MKRLVICCDGTWNTPDQEENHLPAPTNVCRLFTAVAEADAAGCLQSRYYHPGVGAEGSLLARTAGGVYGDGLDKNIKSAYSWLAAQYEPAGAAGPGDAIYFFGFSRGAYTVRSLGGLIGRCGLPVVRGLNSKEAWARVGAAYDHGYQGGQEPARWRQRDWAWLEPARVPIEFIGVWDTVGARGVPDDLALLNLLDDPETWRFYDTKLGPHVRKARHAVAIDEMRASFTPTLWTDDHGRPLVDDGTGRVKQLWFPGVHCDVGGGYGLTGLSDIALGWMIEEAKAAGLAFVDSFVQQVRPDPRGVLHDSLKGVFKAFRSRPRSVPDLTSGDVLHPAAGDRYRNPPITQAPYHPTRKLRVGEETTVPVYAREHWNRTGIYLEAGASYRFTAEGEWLDSSIACGPEGTDDGKFQPAEVVHLVGSVLGKLEGVFQTVSGNKAADFALTRRIESMPWFALVGAVANDGASGDGTPQPDGSPTPHEYLFIKAGPHVHGPVERPGYLFAFANDAWHFYDNNRGSVMLTVSRTA